ncbi:MAG TPA: hypothetical protein VH394_27415 [Thermoanaerobaculia bacterium]|jgi:photosystem II stability/assembly factor-like uncharacterized protein|nr:hypothetical protein [Thermoanaerobaculia bacterium]
MKTRNLLRLLLLLAAVPVRAGVNNWTPFGPGQAAIEDFVLWFGTPSGVTSLFVLAKAPFVTTDDGESWIWRGAGLPASFYEGWPTALAADPAAPPGTLYTSNLRGQVYRSVDAGGHWTFLSTIQEGADDQYFYNLAVAGGTLYAGSSLGVFRSLDGGLTWSLTGYKGYAYAVVADPRNPETLYAGGPGLFRSTDRGETWSALLEVEGDVTAVAVSADSSTLYVGDSMETVYTSTDRGETWQATGVGQRILGLAVDPGKPSRVYASTTSGFFVSADAGDTWQPAPVSKQGPVTVDPSRHNMVYALSYDDGLAVSRDHGATWSVPLQRGLGFPATDLLERNPDKLSILVLCRHDDGLECLRSSDGGKTWASLLGYFNLSRPAVRDLAFEPRNPDYVYVVVVDGLHLVRLSDRGVVRLPFDGQRAEGLRTVAVSGSALVVGGDFGAYRRTGTGKPWKAVLPYVVDKATRTVRSVENLVQDPENVSILYALTREASLGGGSERRVLYQSLDGGARWRRLLEGSRILAVDPSRPKTLYAVRGSDLLVSRDRGATWKVQGSFPTAAVQDLAVDPERPSVLLAATDGSGVLLSEDAGRTWAPFNTGLAGPGLLRVRKVKADPAVPGRFFALPLGSFLPPAGGLFEATVD